MTAWLREFAYILLDVAWWFWNMYVLIIDIPILNDTLGAGFVALSDLFQSAERAVLDFANDLDAYYAMLESAFQDLVQTLGELRDFLLAELDSLRLELEELISSAIATLQSGIDAAMGAVNDLQAFVVQELSDIRSFVDAAIGAVNDRIDALPGLEEIYDFIWSAVLDEARRARDNVLSRLATIIEALW